MKARLNATGIIGIVKELAAIGLGAALLFASNGGCRWMRGWIYIGSVSLYELVYVLLLCFINPRLLNERGRMRWRSTTLYDRCFAVAYTLFSFISVIVAGADVGRWRNTPMPFATLYPGMALFIVASVLALWAFVHNANFILTQMKDCTAAPSVCTTGPYRYVRHPGYCGVIFAQAGFPLIVGSYLSIIPVACNILFIIIRTYLEDTTLKTEMRGYGTYASVTRYRLLPFIW